MGRVINLSIENLLKILNNNKNRYTHCDIAFNEEENQIKFHFIEIIKDDFNLTMDEIERLLD